MSEFKVGDTVILTHDYQKNGYPVTGLVKGATGKIVEIYGSDNKWVGIEFDRKISTDDDAFVEYGYPRNAKEFYSWYIQTNIVKKYQRSKYVKQLQFENESIDKKIKKYLLKNLGKHNDVPDSEFDPKELKMGIDVETEHTNDKEIAKRIAKDHLTELPDYYSRLKKMEKKK